MADTKITDLTAASAALATHEYVVNEAGADRKVTGAQISALAVTIKVKETDQSVSSTTLADDTVLQFAMAADTKYWFKIDAFINETGASDFKWRITGPASPTTVKVNYRQAPANAGPGESAHITAYPGADILLLTGANEEGHIEIQGFIHNGSTAGDFKFQFARNAGTDAATVRGSSTIMYRAM